MPAQLNQALSGTDVPDPSRTVIAGRDHALAIGAEYRVPYWSGVTAKLTQDASVTYVPDPHNMVAIFRPGDEEFAIGAESRSPEETLPPQFFQTLPGGRVPDPCCVVPT